MWGSFAFRGSPPTRQTSANASTRSRTDQDSIRDAPFAAHSLHREADPRGRLIIIDRGIKTCRASFTHVMGNDRNAPFRNPRMAACGRSPYFLRDLAFPGSWRCRKPVARADEAVLRGSVRIPAPPSDPQRADIRRRIVRLHRIARNGGKQDGVGSANRRSPSKQPEVRGTPALRDGGDGKPGRPESEVFSNGAESFPSGGLPALPKDDPVTGRLGTVTKSNHTDGSLN